MLRLMRSGLVLSTTAYALPLRAAGKARPRRVLAGLLLPLSGANASLGRMIERAASLAAAPNPKVEAIPAFDTGGSAEGAAAAAEAAIRAGAGLLLGPLGAAEVPAAVAAAAGRAPVLSFSNDPALLDSGAFLIGITPAQAVGAILPYARGRGVRRVGIVGGDSGWARAAVAAAERVAPTAGIALNPAAGGGAPAAMLAALRGDGALPDAVLLAEGGQAMAALARMLREEGVQLLATAQTLAGPPGEVDAYDGAWFAGYDPDRFADFARAYQTQHGGEPGMIAALGYDAATIARALARDGTVGRDGLLGRPFDAVSGALRFRSDGSCLRQMAILVAEAGGNRMVGHGTAG
ncbi:ABC transporter substrate-binding protein [Sphingomonas flavalba]|uniref:ABC transporter substrate-binding protein n=1 Tax=Sphingomonas flavalba TaxID=2559804 RepID=UPI0039E10D24